MRLYHGSIAPDIGVLKAVSPLHGQPENKVVYLSGSEVYALFYIWDAKRTKMTGKYVTCRLQDGVVYYEEQFDGQLRAFYEGVSGWLYSAVKEADMQPVGERENMWCCGRDVRLDAVEFIPDVYARILRHADEGRVVVTQMPQETRRQLHAHLAQMIVQQGLLAQTDGEEAVFYRTWFPEAWQMALQNEGLR